MFILTVHFHIVPEMADAFAAAVIRQARNSKTHEVDCLQFDVARSENDPAHFFLYEVYSSAEAFERHKQTAYFADYQRTVAPMVEKKEVGRFGRIEPATTDE